jgi:hypothetical protein
VLAFFPSLRFARFDAQQPLSRLTRALLLLFAMGLVGSTALKARAQADAEAPDWGQLEDAPDAETAPDAEPALQRDTSPGVPFSPTASQLMGADQDLERWDRELRKVQRQTRAYFGSWFVGQTALTSVNIYIAMNGSTEAKRAAFSVASALSAANFLYLLVQGWPALGSHKRFRKMPSSTLEEKVAKATYAQEVIYAQRNKDRMVNEIERHIGAFVVGTGAGLGIGLAYKDLYEGLSLGIGIIAVAELLILTRPSNFHTPEKRPTFAQSLRVTPWADKYARGLGLSAQF